MSSRRRGDAETGGGSNAGNGDDKIRREED
jgi:hypothetical protein